MNPKIFFSLLASDGQHFYMHPVNIKCLAKVKLNYDDVPFSLAMRLYFALLGVWRPGVLSL